jgi:hypothetical protein
VYVIRSLISAGATDREVRRVRQSKQRLVAGVYADPGLDPWERYRLLCQAAIARLKPGAVLSGPSAALFWGVPMTGPPPPVVYVSNVTRGTYGPGVRVLAASDAVEQEGLLLASPAATVARCAPLCGSREALVVADAMLADGLCTPADLAEVAARMHRCKGAGRVRWLAEHADARSESPGETWARHVVTQLGYDVVPQFEVRHENRVARIDLLVEGTMTAIEYDGLDKYRTKGVAQVVAEHLREGDLQEMGYRFVRLVSAQLPLHAQLDRRLRVTGARPVRRPRFLTW